MAPRVFFFLAETDPGRVQAGIEGVIRRYAEMVDKLRVLAELAEENKCEELRVYEKLRKLASEA